MIPPIAPSILHHHDHSGGLRVILTILFIMVLVNAYFSRFRKGDEVLVSDNKGSGDSLQYLEMTVEGMTCGHCKESVENVVNSFSGVEEASVDLTSGKVIMTGIDIEVELIKEKIISRGFSIK